MALSSRKLEKNHSRSPPACNGYGKKGSDQTKNVVIKSTSTNTNKPAGHYSIDTQACETQVCCILLQRKPDWRNQPRKYWMFATVPSNRNIQSKKAFAVIWTVLFLHPAFRRRWFTVRTDHTDLTLLLTMWDATGKLVRWRIWLSEFDFQVVHRYGIQHQSANAPSRRRGKETVKAVLDAKTTIVAP